MSGSTKAPDGLPWPDIIGIACDTSEQDVIAFGHVPAEWGVGAPVHYGQLDETPHPLFEPLGYPWRCERANLGEGDYALLGPDGAPIPRWCAIETKRNDLVSSFTANRVALEAEFKRLAPYRFPCLVACVSTERLVGATGRQPRAAASKERSLIGTLMALSTDYRVPMYLMPDRTWAEYTTAWILLRTWRQWLTENPDGLAATRLWWANHNAHARPVETAELPARRKRERDPVLPPPRIDVPGYMTPGESRASKARSV